MGPLRPIYDLRRRMPDTNVAPMAEMPSAGGRTCLFSDQEYAAFLQEAGGSVKYALAQALYTVANNRALTAIYVQLGAGASAMDTRTAAVQIAARADALMRQAEASENAPQVALIADTTDRTVGTPVPFVADPQQSDSAYIEGIFPGGARSVQELP